MTQVVFNTNGEGYWSDDIKPVTITDMQIDYINEELDFGELRVYFDTTTWNTQDSDVIYTDPQFMREMRAFLDSHGLAGADVDYSERGMQGEDYVSCDVGKAFLDSWARKFGIDWTAVRRQQAAEAEAVTEKFVAKFMK
jgi:hypothetical protein